MIPLRFNQESYPSYRLNVYLHGFLKQINSMKWRHLFERVTHLLALKLHLFQTLFVNNH